MQSQYVCRETTECNGLVNKTSTCEKCGKPCQEELMTGEIILRKEIPEYILKDIQAVEIENTKLMNEWVLNTERLFFLHKGLQANLERREHLQNKIRNQIENGIKKLRLYKDALKWGYDPFKKTFVALKKPISKVIEEDKK